MHCLTFLLDEWVNEQVTSPRAYQRLCTEWRKKSSPSAPSHWALQGRSDTEKHEMMMRVEKVVWAELGLLVRTWLWLESSYGRADEGPIPSEPWTSGQQTWQGYEKQEASPLQLCIQKADRSLPQKSKFGSASVSEKQPDGKANFWGWQCATTD